MLYVNVSATGLYQNDEFTQYYSHMIYRKVREVHWIETLNTVTPSGLNKKSQFGNLWPDYQVERDTMHVFHGMMPMTS